PKGDNLLAMWSGKTGSMMPGSPMVLEDFTFFNSQAIADLNGDDYPEVITGSGGYFVHAFDACGREPVGFPKFTGGWIIPTAAVGDLDGDDKLEMVTGTRDGWLYAWHTEGKSDGVIEWESFHHDNRNTGNLEEKLDQGTKKKAARPLTAEMCEAAPPPVDVPLDLEAKGGCACEAAGHSGSGGMKQSAPAALGLLGLALAARNRRRRRA
ncbi:MAG: VCBS repeat-containing protein, partial [Byssovorax sp.]